MNSTKCANGTNSTASTVSNDSTRRNRRIAVAVVLAAAVAQGGSAVADDGPDADTELGRIAYTDGTLTLDPADTAHLLRVGRAGTRDDSAPGWDTTGVPGSAVAGDTVRWSLAGVDGPGQLKVYGTEGDQPLFDSADGQPDVRRLPVGARADTRWEFSADGTYQVIFNAEATAADGRDLSVGTVYTVVVGDTAAADESSAGQEVPFPETPASSGAVEQPGAAIADESEAGSRAAKTATATTLTAAADDNGDDSAVVSEKKVLDDGHVDFAARVVDGKLQIHLKDGTVAGRTIWREPSSVVLHVKPAARNTVPDNDEFTFLGQAGAPVWLLDQVQQEGLLWPGWSTDNITAGATEGNVRFSLTAVDGPGAYALYTYDAMSGADVLFDSGDGVPDSFDVAPNTHAHGGWAFTAQGTYRLTFRMSGKLAGGKAVSDTETVTFVVGDTDPSTVSPGGGTDQGSAGSSNGDPGSSDTSGAGSTSGSQDGSASEGAGGAMASTGAGGAVLTGGSAAALTAAGVLSVLAARRRGTRRG
ncbi:TIGR03773 family transporter-associated surface protein [Streptomyces sp. NPDC023723]|uniref:TIGR03773 family transporter-associated surface protein n=1 Tax=Streptomyces sp. NPDC023723 TaxID=3154323 RepID=UPI0033CAAE4F